MIITPHVTDNQIDAVDPVRQQLGEVSLRLLAGAVPGKAFGDARRIIERSGGGYPWEEVNQRVIEDDLEEAQLIRQGLQAQRDWILRGGAPGRKRKSLKARGKGFVAFVLSRLIFFVFYTVAVVVLLVMLKHHWPQIDVYVALEWLRDTFPTVFPRR